MKFCVPFYLSFYSFKQSFYVHCTTACISERALFFCLISSFKPLYHDDGNCQDTVISCTYNCISINLQLLYILNDLRIAQYTLLSYETCLKELTYCF